MSRHARLAVVTTCLAAAALLAPSPASAHALIVREDLPIPTWLFAWGASLVLIVSFFVLGFAWHNTRFEGEGWRPLAPRLSRVLLSQPVRVLCGAIGVFLLGLTIWSGVHGTDLPGLNFAITFVFVTIWIGLVLVSVVFGDVFRASNPWAAIARAAKAFLRVATGQEPRSPLRYPSRLGRWPAALGILIFVWLELISEAGSTTGVQPRTTAIAVLAYSGYTLAAMALFGIEKWLDNGETFSVYFGMFSRLSAIEARDGQLGVRRPLAATTSWAQVPGSIAVAAFTIGATTFDGAQEGVLASPIQSLYRDFVNLGLGSRAAIRFDETLWLLVSLAFVASVYCLGVLGMRLVRGSPPARDLARRFAHTLIPIGLAYVTAHYFSLVVYQEQAQFTYLLSDPLGNGANYFGTAGGGVDYAVLTANAIWYVQVGALVVGHTIGLTLGHDRAIAIYGDSRRASLSQRWMLLMMVSFTCVGLFLLSQANG